MEAMSGTLDPSDGSGASRPATGPFEVRGSLGSGGMGVVYRAFDRRLGRDVALKVLRQGTARDLYRFKREFRAIAGILHPNLVTLHELHTSGDEWFFTMDLVDGVSFVDWVRPGDRDASRTRTRRDVMDARVDLARLRAALPQLIDGVLALHVCGKLHRDLKPSNVLVDGSGRVVVLDFGLVSDVERIAVDRTHDQAAVGTPAYMSPEQASDQTLTEASDWYAIGVMLYEALTGRRPFEGASETVMRRKLDEAARPPSELDASVPPDLDELCRRLLATRPADRPDGRAVLATLGAQPSAATTDLERTSATGIFVGRHDELAAMRTALADSRQRAVTLFVCGESGIGKSQLVRRFIDDRQGDIVVLEGRCYERESVPFRALDGAIDALTGVLLGLPADEQRRVVTSDAAALARLFPVLRRVPAVAEVALSVPLFANPQEIRRRAFEALRAILAGLAAHDPVIIAIDDLQWGDADSAVFLNDLASHPESPPVLVLLMHRPEDDAGIVAAVQRRRPDGPSGDHRSIRLGPLSDAEAQHLVDSFGGGDHTRDVVVREGRGHPLFLAELARSSSHRGHQPATLDELIQRRIAALPAGSAALLRTMAVAARPLSLEHAADATQLAGPASELQLLRAERLARVRVDDGGGTAIEPYHDRVRHAVVAAMPPDELRRTHQALATAYESRPATGDLEAVVAHWMAAGQPGRAAARAVEAAHGAESALAFHRAADLYALAIEHGGGDAAAQSELHRLRAEALTSAGRLDEAADAFADALPGASADTALVLETRRLEQILRRGRMAEGRQQAQQMLARIGITLPTSLRATIRAVLLQLVRLKLRGLGFTERREADVPAATLHRVDLLFSVSTGLSMINPAHGMLVQCHHLRAALDAGEPKRACSALAIELGYYGQRGARVVRRVDELSIRVRDLADRVDDAYVRGRATTMRGFVSFLVGRWRDAAVLCEAGLGRMTEEGVGVRWDFDVIEMIQIGALAYLGEARELARLVPQRLREANERGDVYAPGDLRGGRGNIAWLIMDRADEARAHVTAVEQPMPAADAFQVRHLEHLRSHAHIDLYVGDPAAAWQRLEAAWPTVEASLLLKTVQLMRIEGAFLRACVALATAYGAEAAMRAQRARLARKLARRLAAEGADWATACSHQIHAMIAVLDGDHRVAAERLELAERAYSACDMRLHATVVRLRRGQLEGHTTGETLAASARDAMREQAIGDPDAMARMLCPWPSTP
jgi:eukaryotic-like serine/threonine-protein kinase